MREIKFRAWDTVKKVMVHSGDLYHWGKLDSWELQHRVYPCTVTSHGIIFSNKLSNEQANDYVELTKGNEHSTYYKNCEAEQLYCNGIEIMQCTGLKDKNGREIYEGDIVKADDCNPEYEQVEFIEGGFCLTNPLIEGYPMDINSFYPSVGCLLEVIGNIYENPELMGR